MKLVRAATVLAGIADLGFGVLFLLKPGAFHPKMEPFVYARWVGLALLGSAAVLFVVASGPEAYLPFLYVNITARGLATLLTILYITHFTLFVAILPSHGFLVAILVAALVYEMKPRFEAAKKLGAAKKPAAGPAQAKTAKKAGEKRGD